MEEIVMLWSILAGLCFMAWGALMFLKPQLIWTLTEKWKSYRADEPSDLYCVSTKFGGVMFALCGLMMVVLPLILE